MDDDPHATSDWRRTGLMEMLLFAGVLAVWFALNLWVLPRLGVPT
jgi:hypothetical protein